MKEYGDTMGLKSSLGVEVAPGVARYKRGNIKVFGDYEIHIVVQDALTRAGFDIEVDVIEPDTPNTKHTTKVKVFSK